MKLLLVVWLTSLFSICYTRTGSFFQWGCEKCGLGEYVLNLHTTDGEYGDDDQVTINVYNDSCEAAQAVPGYEPFLGDVNGDCIFDQLDLDILNADWLKDNSLTDD